MKAFDLIEGIRNHEYDDQFTELYSDIEKQKKRYIDLISKYAELYGDDNVQIFSAPGRSEIGGNHTDHQHGKVLACAIDLDMVCVLSFTDDGIVELTSEGFGTSIVDLNDLEVKEEEKGTSASLIRGIAYSFKKKGLAIKGFKAFMVSDVLGGSGLSSSAAFESLIGTIFSKGLNDGTVNDIEIARIGQYAENVYFGKPCGLMDQMAASCGGFVYIDFKDEPKVEKIDFNLSEYGYRLCVIDTRASHASLTDEYATIPLEMKLIAAYFGKEYLSEINEEEFYENISELRKLNNDRAILRTHHFLSENKRVPLMAKALKNKDIDTFFKFVKRSGDSSYKYLQNIYASDNPYIQEISLGLALIEKFLDGKGAYRVHGGGFAGTVQAYVKEEDIESFKELMEMVFGKDCVYVLNIRKSGAIRFI